jgi:1,4-alpha-glucan branching enzyme
VHRKHHHHELTFGLLYAFDENFVLPLSHDEVVHLKGSLVHKMPGDDWQKLANLRALYGWMWAHPGKQLLFMGSELAQWEEWAEVKSLDWHLLDAPAHRGVRDLVAALNAIESREPALWRGDFTPDGFRWLDADDADESVYSFVRFDPNGEARPVVAVANLTPIPRYGHRIGLPIAGRWDELLNTDATDYAGSGVGNEGAIDSQPIPWHGFEQSALATLPPLAVVWFAPAAH